MEPGDERSVAIYVHYPVFAAYSRVFAAPIRSGYRRLADQQPGERTNRASGRLMLSVILLMLALQVVAVLTSTSAQARVESAPKRRSTSGGLRMKAWDVIEDPTALARLRSLADARGLTAVATPTFLVRGQLIVGCADRESTGRRLAGAP